MENIVITGCSRGLGYELLKCFHEHEHFVFPLVRKEQDVEKIKKEFPIRCHPIKADISSDTCIEHINKEIGRITQSVDIVINNAGIRGVEKEILKVTINEMKELFNIHCLGIVRTTKSLIPFLRNSENPRIINVSSRLGSISKIASGEFKGTYSYSYRVAKAAQNMLTICLSEELKSIGIHVSAIHPGKLKTLSGPIDADKEPQEAAKSIYDWVMTLNLNNTGQFVEPGVGHLTW